MSFPVVKDDSPKKLKQDLLIPLGKGLLPSEQKGRSDFCIGQGQGSSSSSGQSEYIATKKRNRLRLHDRKSINSKDGWGEQGGYMNAKKQKLAKQFQANKHQEIFNIGKSTDIFQGVSIYVNGYTKPSSDELKRLMMLHGGRYEMYLSKEAVTHIIATNLPDSKITSLRNYKVVHPDWIIKSIEAGRLLSYTSFLLFTSQSKLQRGIFEFSVANDKNQNPTATITKAETISSLSFPTDRNIFKSKNTVSSTNFENQAGGSTFDDFLESPQSCHSDDLFEESFQESKKFQKNQQSKTDIHLPKYPNSLPTEIVPSKNELSPCSDFDLTTLSGDDEEMLAFPLEMEAAAPPLSLVNAVDTNKGGISSLNQFPSSQHKTLAPEMCQDGQMQVTNVAEITKETSKKTSPINLDSKPSISTYKPSPSSATDTFTKINPGVHKSKSHSPNAKTAREPNYLNQFYTNSRLHHLSTWKVEWKNYVSEIKARFGNNFPGRQKLISPSATVTNHNSKPNTSSSHRTIMHIDMDSFFVSVALRDRLDLKDKPVAVTHSQKKGPSSDRPGVDVDYERQQWIKRRKERALKGKVSTPDMNGMEAKFDDDDDDEDLFNEAEKALPLNNASHATDPNKSTILRIIPEQKAHQSFSDIASCNYVARKAGLRNGMHIGDALKLCPNLITLPYEFEKYQEVSKILYDSVTSYTHDIEAVSCDEMLVECTSLLQETGADVGEFVSMLRQEIFEKTGCTASAGLGPNILLARLATHKAKPNGQFFVQDNQIVDFIKDQEIKIIPGVGRSMMYKLEHLCVKTCGELQNLSLSTLQKEFGPKTGQLLYNYSRGKDDRSLQMEYNQKSVSAEINYGIRFKDDNDMDDFLKTLSSEVESRLKKANKQGKTISLKLMVRRPDAPLETAKYMGHGLCNNICKSVTLAMATDQSSVISKKCMLMYKALKLTASDLRGIGISIQRLESTKNVGAIGSFVSNHSKTPNILKFTKAIPQKTECQKSPPMSSSSYSLTQEDSDAFTRGAADDDDDDDGDFHSMQPIRVKTFGTINFMEEMSRQKKGSGKFPPLPRLPSQGTLAQFQPLKMPSPTSEDFLPSPSQVDADVLNELPADIRCQIQMALNEKQKKKNDIKSKEQVTSRVVEPVDSNKPSCSHWTSPHCSDFVDEQEVRVEGVHNTSIHNISDVERELLPNLSQVDESCFNELPEDIQQEMRVAMKRREICKQDEAIALSAAKVSSTVSSPIKMMVLLSPTKDSSPNKPRGVSQKRKSPQKKKSPGKKGSPHFKVPRGRPRGRRGAIGTRKVVDARKKLFLYGDIDKKYPEANPAVESNIQASELPSIVNLCGAVTIAEVRDLLREWLTTCPDPTVDDELFVIDYLKALIQDKNLEQIDLVLKFLYRNICHLRAENWFVSFENIVQTVQKAVMSQYNSKLKLGFTFPITFHDRCQQSNHQSLSLN